MFINYAHRGASEYEPENTMQSFRLGIAQGATGIETDVRETRDGVLVLFHDENMERCTGIKGNIRDYTLQQLSGSSVHCRNNPEIKAGIATLKELLEYAAPLNINLAVELKADGIEKRVIDMINSFGLKERCIITSFSFESLANVKQYDSSFKIGYLVRSLEEKEIGDLIRISGEQICHHVDCLNTETVLNLKAMGFNVRAWGVSTPEKMEKAYSCGVDGMTVNFPDLLTELINKKHG